MAKSERVRAGGDAVFGDKVNGDKVMGDKVLGDKIGFGPEDVAAMMRFVEAVALRSDQLSDRVRQPAVEKLAEIDRVRRRPESAGRLRELVRSLRTILEGASGDLVAAGLLALWVPGS